MLVCVLNERIYILVSISILHNTEELNERFLKLLVACAMEPKCMAPPTAKWTCDFDFSGKLYADCHRYDESAMNIILKNWFNFDNSIILRNPTTFKVYDPSEKMPLKMCRDTLHVSYTQKQSVVLLISFGGRVVVPYRFHLGTFSRAFSHWDRIP
jgi:hypothetical protein